MPPAAFLPRADDDDESARAAGLLRRALADAIGAMCTAFLALL